MKKTRILVILSAIFIAIGTITFVLALGNVDWDIKKLSTTRVKYSVIDVSNDKIDLADVEKIDFEGDVVDVEICYGVELSITYPEVFTLSGKPATKVKMRLEQGVLMLSSDSIWHRTIGLFNFDDGKAQIVLPRDRNIDLSINTDTGDVKFIGDASAKTDYVIVETDTGNVTMQDVVVDTAKIEVDTGDVKVVGSRCEVAKIEADTGDLKMTNSVIGELKAETDTGDVSATNCIVEKLEVGTDTGKINMVDSEAQKAVFEVSTGDVKLEDSVLKDLNARTSTGDVKIVGEVRITKASIRTSTGDVGGKSGILDTNEIKITTKTGDIRLTLKGKKTDFTFIINVSTGHSNTDSITGGDKLFDAKVSTGDIKLYFAE